MVQLNRLVRKVAGKQKVVLWLNPNSPSHKYCAVQAHSYTMADCISQENRALTPELTGKERVEQEHTKNKTDRERDDTAHSDRRRKRRSRKEEGRKKEGRNKRREEGRGRKEGRKEAKKQGRKEGEREGRKEGRKEGRREGRKREGWNERNKQKRKKPRLRAPPHGCPLPTPTLAHPSRPPSDAEPNGPRGTVRLQPLPTRLAASPDSQSRPTASAFTFSPSSALGLRPLQAHRFCSTPVDFCRPSDPRAPDPASLCLYSVSMSCHVCPVVLLSVRPDVCLFVHRTLQ